MFLTVLPVQIVLLLIMSFLFSGSETALFSLSKSELYSFSISRKKNELRLASMMKRPQGILVTILTGNLLANIYMTSIVTDYLVEKFPEFGHLIAIGIVTPVVIFICEIIPKLLSVRASQTVARSVSGIIYFMHFLFLPFTFFLHRISNMIYSALRLSQGEGAIVTEQEIDTVLSSHEQYGYLAPEESSFIRNVLYFSKKDAKNVMIPRNTAVTVEYSTPVKELLKLVRNGAPQRIPVYKNSPDTIIGMIDTRDLVPYAAGLRKGRAIGPVIQPVVHYPESKELGDLLADFVTSGIQMAVLVDEYGGTSGFVTLSSIISEVMGDDFSLDDEKVKREVWTVKNRTVVSADMQLHDFNQQFEDSVDSYESETLGGYITERLGHFPKRGEIVNTALYRMKVRGVSGNRIKSIEIEKHK